MSVSVCTIIYNKQNVQWSLMYSGVSFEKQPGRETNLSEKAI